MKRIIIALLIVLCTVKITAQNFYLDTNGITIKCEYCQPGDTGSVNGILYEAVDRALLDQRRDEGADLSWLCTSLVTDLEHLFSGMTEFNQDLSSWDVSHVTNMRGLFNGAASFNQDIGAWDVTNVTRMDYLFHNAELFNQDIGAWDVSNVTRMNCMFSGDSLSLDQINEEPLFTTFNQDIGNWDVSNVTIMFQMFSYNSAFNQDIGGWDVSNVRDMKWMFQNCAAFNQDIGDWDVSNVTMITDMFGGATSFNQDIGSWYIKSLTDMDSLFYNASSFNQDISSWDVSDVKEMKYMFYGAESFNQDLSGWCVENIATEPESFANNCPLQSSYFPVWGTCPEMDTTSTDMSDHRFNSLLAEKIVLYPNPTNDIFTLTFEAPIQGVFEINNLNGQLIYRRPITSTSEQMDMTSFPKGIYFITVKSDECMRIERVVKL